MRTHKILRVLLLILPFLTQSCYTVLVIPEHTPPGITKEERELNSFYKMDVKPGREITGIWTKTILWMDYGYAIERLEFFPDGSMMYFRNYEQPKGEIIEGTFRTVSDTLIIKFAKSLNLEKNRFAIAESELKISSLYEMNNGVAHYGSGILGNWSRVK